MKLLAKNCPNIKKGGIDNTLLTNFGDTSIFQAQDPDKGYGFKFNFRINRLISGDFQPQNIPTWPLVLEYVMKACKPGRNLTINTDCPDRLKLDRICCQLKARFKFQSFPLIINEYRPYLISFARLGAVLLYQHTNIATSAH